MTVPPHVVSGQPIAASWGNGVVDELQRQVDYDTYLNNKIDGNWGSQNNINQYIYGQLGAMDSRIAVGAVNGEYRNGTLLVQGGGGTYTTDSNGAFSIVFAQQYVGPVAVVVNNIVQSFPIVSQAFDIRANLFQVMNRWITNPVGEPFVNSAISIAWVAIGWRI